MKPFQDFLLRHLYGLKLAIFIFAAVAAGFTAVWFMWGFEWVLKHRLDAHWIGDWRWVTTPIVFLMAVELIRRAAPEADGSGIPQIIVAARHLSHEKFKTYSGLVSLKTMVIKVIALLLGVWACASTGREGPTVQVAACVFFTIAFVLHRMLSLPFDMRSAVVGGGAAGLAAAFNTPLAGVTFAIEELSSDYFGSIKDIVLVGIVIAGIAAKSLTGEYIYFGRSVGNPSPTIWAIICIGVLGGAAGAFFSTALIEGRKWIVKFRGPKRIALIVACSLLLIGAGMYSPLLDVFGPGNVQAQGFLQGSGAGAENFFVSKLAATLFTYWSGIAGGIFAPSLSMGSAIGVVVGPWFHASPASCALIGMSAFMAGAIQAPITSFVIIFEMTDDHQMLLPIMLCALIGFMTARVFRAKHLYQSLAEAYSLPDDKPTESHA